MSDLNRQGYVTDTKYPDESNLARTINSSFFFIDNLMFILQFGFMFLKIVYDYTPVWIQVFVDNL